MNIFPWTNFHGLNLNWIVSEIEGKMPLRKIVQLPAADEGTIEKIDTKLIFMGRMPVILDADGSVINLVQITDASAIYTNINTIVTVLPDGRWTSEELTIL